MKRKIINMLLMLITVFALAACFIACGDDGKGAIDNSDVKDVKDIEMGYTHAQVRDILGAPYVRSSMEASDTTWKYYDKSYVNISDKIDEKSDEMTKAVMAGDADKASKLTEDIMKLEQQLSNLTYKYIEINFAEEKEGDNKVYKVSDVLYDSVRNANAAVAKKTKSVSFAKVPALSDMSRTDVPVKISYTDGSYKNTYVNRQYFTGLNTFTTDSKEVTWSDNWGIYTATVTVATDIPKGTVLKGAFGAGTYAATALSAGNLSGIPDFSAVIESSGTVIGGDGNYEYWNKVKGKVKDVTVSDGVKELAEDCFASDNRFESITLPEDLETVGNNAFKGCKNLTTAIVPVTAIAQLPKSKLKEVTIIGDGEIAAQSFMNCETLEKLTISDKITKIDDRAFNGYASLSSVTIPENVTYIGAEAFTACQSLFTVNFNATACSGPVAMDTNGVANKFDVFDSAVKTVVIGENVERITHRLFRDTSIESITIPQSVDFIGMYAFSGCKNLTEVNYNATECSTPKNSEYNYDSQKWIYYNYTIFNSVAANVTIGDNVKVIPDQLFASSAITSLTIGSGVEDIGSTAFYRCNDNLENITVKSENSVYHSAGNCLIDTQNKTLILGCKSSVIPTDGSVTSLSVDAFSYCSSLTSIVIPSSIANIENRSFNKCSGLTTVIISDGVEIIGEYVFEYCSSLTSVAIGNTVTNIGACAFRACRSLTSVTIGNEVSSIGNAAFEFCSSLTNLSLPNSVTSIGAFAFNGCSSLLGIEIQDGVQTIGNWAFEGCSRLTSISIPSSVTNIGHGAFYECSNLTSVHITDIDSWCRIQFEYESVSNPLYYAHNLYLNNELVTELVIPDTVTTIKQYAFYGCSSISSVIIPNSVTYIAKQVFCNCSSLTSIRFSGTIKQWNEVGKDLGWNLDKSIQTVVCDDGTITL